MIKLKKLNRLSNAFRKLPGIGPKMADRLAYYILHTDSNEVLELVNALEDVDKSLMLCKQCSAPSEKEICEICSNQVRDHSVICVIERIEDLVAIERTKRYNGIYHILGGVISPTEGLGPNNLRIKELLNRMDSTKEIIIATNPTTEGDITANYVAELIRDKNKNMKVTRIGYGLPVGGSLEYADEITLMRSFESRKEIISE